MYCWSVPNADRGRGLKTRKFCKVIYGWPLVLLQLHLDLNSHSFARKESSFLPGETRYLLLGMDGGWGKEVDMTKENILTRNNKDVSVAEREGTSMCSCFKPGCLFLFSALCSKHCLSLFSFYQSRVVGVTSLFVSWCFLRFFSEMGPAEPILP